MPVRGSKILLVVFILTTILLGCKKKSSDAETARHGGDVVGRTESLTPPDEIPVGWVGDGEIICYALPLYDHVYGLYEYDLSTRLTRCVSKFELGFLEYATMTHDGRFFFYGGIADLLNGNRKNI